jgi:hypothetical protein
MVSYSYFLKQFLAAVDGEIHSPVEISACSAPSPTNHIKRPSGSASQEIWRPASGRACEYVADLERIRHDALRRPEWKGRPKLFEIRSAYDGVQKRN